MSGTWVATVDLETTLTPTGVIRPPADSDGCARVLVRLHRRPVGFVDVAMRRSTVPTAALEGAIRANLGEALRRHLDADGIPAPAVLPLHGLGGVCARVIETHDPISVVVCTRNHASALARCLAALRRLRHEAYEVLVVDNAPDDDTTRRCFDAVVGRDARFSYLVERRAGLSRARNRGLRTAATRYVAFTDDDVRVDASWLSAVSSAFGRRPDAGCVTGIVPPSALDHDAQDYFERRYTWAAEFAERVYDLDSRRDRSALYPYSAGIFGTGANFAVDRAFFSSLGGFDEALGAGTPAGGGEDLDAFVRVLLAGRSIVYEPAAIAWHDHRCDARALRRQLFFYGCGLTAFLTKHVIDPGTRGEVLGRIGPGLTRVAGAWSPSRIGKRAPPMLVLAELFGMGAGPIAYARGRIRNARTRPERAGARQSTSARAA